jgi:hypothetical protein
VSTVEQTAAASFEESNGTTSPNQQGPPTSPCRWIQQKFGYQHEHTVIDGGLRVNENETVDTNDGIAKRNAISKISGAPHSQHHRESVT